MLQVVALVGLGGLPEDLGDLALELVEGAAGGVGGIGGHLGAVQGDGAELDHPRGGAQPQRGDQEPGQGLLVPHAEAGEGHVIGELVAGQHPEGEVLAAAPLDLPRGAHPDRVAVQQHAQQHLGVVGGMAVPVGAVGAQERLQVQLVDDVQHEPGQVSAGSQSRRSGGSRKGWSRSPRRTL